MQSQQLAKLLLQWGPALFAGKDPDQWGTMEVPPELQWGPALFAGKDDRGMVAKVQLLAAASMGPGFVRRERPPKETERPKKRSLSLQWGPALFAGKDNSAGIRSNFYLNEASMGPGFVRRERL